MMQKDTPIYVFDLDDTLIHTSAKIIIRNSKNKIIRRIPTSEYNAEQDKSVFLHDGDYFDFSEFNSYDILKNERPTDTFKIMRKRLKEGHNICILTSREDPDMIRTWLYKVHGIDITRNIGVFCTSQKDYPFTGTDAEKKRKTLDFLCYGFGESRFHVYEDSPAMMEEMGMAVEHNPKIYYIKDEFRKCVYTNDYEDNEDEISLQQGDTEEAPAASEHD